MCRRNQEGGLVADVAGGIVILIVRGGALVVCFNGDGWEVDGFLRPRSLDALFACECLECFECFVVKA